MKLGEFVKRARASRLKRAARFEDAYRRLRQELSVPVTRPETSPAGPGFAARRTSKRATLTLFPKD